jgi:hypothetical protein
LLIFLRRKELPYQLFITMAPIVFMFFAVVMICLLGMLNNVHAEEAGAAAAAQSGSGTNPDTFVSKLLEATVRRDVQGLLLSVS